MLLEINIEMIRSALGSCGELTEAILNSISLLFIVIGVINSFFKSISKRQASSADHPRHTYFRRVFGGWLMVALEFQLAADIVATIISPDKEQLLQLGAIALIRTFLNYFLNRELNEAQERYVVKREEQASD